MTIIILKERKLDGDIEGEKEVKFGVEYVIYDLCTSWKLVKPHVGEMYATIQELWSCLTNYAIMNGYPNKIVKSFTKILQIGYGNCYMLKIYD